MEQRQLGKDGPMVPVLGFGAWPIGGGMGNVDEKNAIATIHAAIDNGITLIDTAQSYLISQEIIGKALKGRRDQVFLATKASFDFSRQGILDAMEDSLRKLLTGKYTPDYLFPSDDERSGKSRFQGEEFKSSLAKAERLKAVARARNLSLVQLAIGWQLRLAGVTCVLVGAKNPDQVEEHVGAVGWSLTEGELAEIENILEG